MYYMQVNKNFMHQVGDQTYDAPSTNHQYSTRQIPEICPDKGSLITHVTLIRRYENIWGSGSVAQCIFIHGTNWK